MFCRVKLICGLGLRRGSGESGGRRRTALYDLHVEKGGKMTEFGGFVMPVSYAGRTVPQSVLHTRSEASLFDVSHMLQTEITGRHAVQYLESLCVTDIAGMGVNTSALSLFLNEKTGGILDDLVVTKCEEDKLHLVTNASRRVPDKRLMLKKQEEFRKRGKEVEVRFLEEEVSLLAVQGPRSGETVERGLGREAVSGLRFMESRELAGGVRVSRCGYTGEDGFEISLPARLAPRLAADLLRSGPSLALAGLAARDTLRLEAGLCLYGSDIDVRTTPVTAGLMWTISKARRERGDVPGWEGIMKEKERLRGGGEGLKRVGLRGEGGRVARRGAWLCEAGSGGRIVGRVTSGCHSPTLGASLAMAYLPASLARPGTLLHSPISTKTALDLTVVKMPFLPAKYCIEPNK